MNKEIKESIQRIELRETNINTELDLLSRKINRFSNWAWFFVVLGFFIAFYSIFDFYSSDIEGSFGLNLLGDFWSGSVASVWSLSGLFFIYVAFLGQKQQLLNQQLEIMYSQLEVKYTRYELKGQKREMKIQNETLIQQKFENTFFQMLGLYNSIINSLDSVGEFGEDLTGRDCFEFYYRSILRNTSWIIHGEENHSIKENADIDKTLEGFEITYQNNKSDLGHYFRTLYQIIKFIDNSTVRDKKQYISIVRAQLSSFEQILLFYNCLHLNGKIKFKPLIEKYELFNNIDDTILVNKDHLKEYNKGAYSNEKQLYKFT
jgi:hypothetical protein